MKHPVPPHLPHAHLYLLIAALLAFDFGAARLRAGTDTWSGGGAPDGNWQNANNWGGIAPVANDMLIFTGSTQTGTTNNFAPGTAFSNIQLDAFADVFTLNGNIITIPTPVFVSYGAGLSASYLDGCVSNLSLNVQTINLPLTLANGHHNITGNAGGGALNLAGTLTLGSASSVSFSDGINVNGTGLTTLNGILGGWATMSPPTTWATLDGFGTVVGYTAFTDIVGGGTISSAPASNVRITTSGPNVTNAAAGTTDINSLFFPDGGAAQTVEIPAGRILRFGSKGGIFNASRQLGTSRVLTIGTAVNVGSVTAGGADNTPGDLYLIETPLIGNTGNQLVMNSRITNNGTGPVTVHIFGHISYPAVTHTYSGGTYIHGGRLSATGPNSLGTGPVIVYAGGQLFLNAAGTYTNAVSISGLGNGESVGNGAIRMGGRTISGTVTLLQDAATANGTLSGRITGPGGLSVGAGNGNGTGTLIIGSAAGANDYAGDTVLNSSNATATSTLQIAATRNNIMPHGTGKGNLIFNGVTVVATLDLNATAQTINGMGFTGTVARAVVTSSAAGAAILTVGDNNANGNYSGTIQNGSGNVGLTKIGSGTQNLTGVCTYTNATTVNGGKLFFGVGSFPAGTAALTVNSNALLDATVITPLSLVATATMSMSNGTVAVSLPVAGGAITTPALVSLGSTNFINVASIPAISTYPATFTAIKYTTLTGTLNFGLGTLPVSPGTPFAGFVSNNVVNGSVDVVVTGGPTSMKWQGYAGGTPDSTWDIANTVNWVTFAGGATTYSDGSFVQFDNTASNGVVTLVQNVAPAGVTITNTALAYTLNGGGKISGGGGLIKNGSGTAILNNSGINDFVGAVTISGGTLQIGNNDGNGILPAGVGVADNAALAFNHNDLISVPNVISGTGSVAQNGTGTLDLSGASTFSGAATVAAGGTLRVNNNSALGATNGATTVADGGTLEIVANAINMGQEPITISGSGVGGAGALVNNSGSLTFIGPNAARLTMAANGTVGGSGRFDLRSATTSNPLLASLSTGGQPYKLTKVGSGTFGFIGITVDPKLGDIEVQQGIFSSEAAMTSLGNPASNIMVWPGGTFQMFAITNQINKIFTLGGDGVTFTVSATSGGANTIIGSMAITNDCIFNVNNNTVVLNLNNVLTGPGKITKVGAGLLAIGGNSPAYTGGLTINNGNASVSGTLNNTLGVSVGFGKFTLTGTLLGAGGLTNVNTTTIAASGTASGTVDVGGNLYPGDTNLVGTFTVGNGLILEPTAVMAFDLAATNTPGGNTNDLVVVNGDLTVNGNAVTINPLGLLLTGAGNPYLLFTYSGNLIWNADLVVTGPNNYIFAVDTNTPGQIKLVATGGPPIWNGGSATTSNWSDTANWNNVAIVPGDSLFFQGPSRLNNVNNTPADTSYTDLNFVAGAGSFTLSGNPITLGGNVINNSSVPQTVNLGLDFSGSHTLNGATAPLIIGGGLTNTANGSTLTLGGSGTLTNLLGATDPATMTNIISVSSNANWTLLDNSSATPITALVQLDIVGGSLTYGSSGSAPNLISTASANNSRIGNVPGAPAALNMVNGTLTIAARLNTGTAANSLAAINQTGGTLNIQALLQVSDGSSLAYSTVTVTGGTLSVGDAGGPNNFFLASRGTGIVTVATSGLISCATLDVSRNASTTGSGSVGVVNLNGGGTLVVNRVGTATSATQTIGTPTATFNFNGGTLRAGASSTTFIQGSTTPPVTPVVCIVKAGGAIIDTTNFNDTIAEPLQHDAILGGAPDGGLLKLGSGTLTLSANGTYTGPTIVTNGTLAVNSTLAATAVAVATNGTLAGTGTAGTGVTVNAGGTLSPATATTTGTLNVAGNVVLQNGSSNVMQLNHTSATSDQVRASAATATTITYGGTLVLTNLSGSLTGSDTFKLFSATNYAGAFSALSPEIPQPGLAWNTNTLATDGTLRFTVTVNTTPTNLTAVVVGNQLNLSWPADHTGWRLQVQTNSLSTGLGNNWVPVTGSELVNSMSFTINPGSVSVFYRMIYP